MAQTLENAADEVAALLGGGSTKRVQYEFESLADTPEWRVRRVRIEESICAGYSGEVELSCPDLSADPSALLGCDCVLTIARDAQIERLCGLVDRVHYGGQTDRLILAKVRIVPALRALEQRMDSRIFQDMSSVEIIEKVLGEGLAEYGREVQNQLSATYAKREYTVQYRETDLAFVSRLMEREGISYYFDHQGELEVVVLVDSSDQYPETETYDGDPVPVVPRRSELTTAEAVHSFHLADQLRPTGVTVRDFDWTRPSLLVESQKESEDGQGRKREVYDHGELNLGGYSAGAHSEIDDETQAELRSQVLHLSQQLFVGGGLVTAFRPGEVFKLVDHPVPAFDGTYLLTRVRHERPVTDKEDEHRQTAVETYRNEFECIRFNPDIPYRPHRRTRKPRVDGMQTATVVGPSGEEIHTDEHGRIKVQFHWDRVGNRDDHSSCWLRVAQSWAGAGFGTLFIPRIGMEVLVAFLEGDPDRPLVVGCVYNGENRLAVEYELPRDKSKTLIRTNSTPGGSGYNELRFEDKAGSEEIFVHAQKDYNEVVENDHSTEVKKNQTNKVKVSQSESVGASQSLTVGGNRTKTVKQDETVTIEKNRTETVKENETITIEGERTETVTKKQTITLEDEQEVTITGKDALTVNNDKADHVTGNYTVDADTQFKLTQGGTTMTLEGDHVQLDAAAFIKAVHGSGSVEIADDGSITLQSGATITLKVGGSEVVISQQGVEIKSVQVKVAGQTGELAVDATGGKLTGPMVTVEGQSMTEIKGAMVKIN